MIRTLTRRKPEGDIYPPFRLLKSKVCPLCHEKKQNFVTVRKIDICVKCFDWVVDKANNTKPKRKRVREKKTENPLTREFCDCGEKATVLYYREMICQRCKDLTSDAAYWQYRDYDGIESKISDQGDLPTLHMSFPDAHIPDEYEHRRWNAGTVKHKNENGSLWIIKSSVPQFRTNFGRKK